MRHTELEEGIDVLDNNGNIVGSSRIAAKHVRTGDGPELLHDELHTRNPTAIGIDDLKEIEMNELHPSCRKNKAIKPHAHFVPMRGSRSHDLSVLVGTGSCHGGKFSA